MARAVGLDAVGIAPVVLARLMAANDPRPHSIPAPLAGDNAVREADQHHHVPGSGPG